MYWAGVASRQIAPVYQKFWQQEPETQNSLEEEKEEKEDEGVEVEAAENVESDSEGESMPPPLPAKPVIKTDTVSSATEQITSAPSLPALTPIPLVIPAEK